MERIYHKLASGLTRNLGNQLDTEDQELILNFFLTFSRLEYGLMQCGYSISDKQRILIDWDRFADNHQQKFQDLVDVYQIRELKEAVDYYKENPPKKQVLIDGIILLKPEIPKKELQFKELINLLQRVRNNLFHGEKLNQLLSDNSELDHGLLRQGLILLYACIEIENDLKRYFV